MTRPPATANGPKVQQFFLDHPHWLSAIGSSCPPGWDDLLSQALAELAELASSRRATISITQIKEKFVELRIYLRVDGEAEQFHFDMVTPTGVMSGRVPPGPDDSVTAAATAIVQRATEKSRATCQTCGRPGSVRQGRWLRTLYDAHAATGARD